MALALVAGFYETSTIAFIPALVPKASHRTSCSSSANVGGRTLTPFVNRRHMTAPTTLKMAQDDFNESKYTEAAWSTIAALTKAADFYEAQSVDAPLLLDIMLNPTRHQAGDDAESARRAVEKILNKAGANVGQLKSDLDAHLAKQPRISGSSSQKTMSRSLQQVLDAAKIAKGGLGDSYISTEGLLLALVKEDSFTRDALLKQDVTYNDIVQAVKAAREKSGPANTRGAENNYDSLLKFGIDFTERAREGKLDPVIGRDAEIRRAIQILSRRTKNNPVLIGDVSTKQLAGDVASEERGTRNEISIDLQRGRLLEGRLSFRFEHTLTRSFRFAFTARCW
jgi:ATP-dependent Clp protease ATP-binding subunit ClpB